MIDNPNIQKRILKFFSESTGEVVELSDLREKACPDVEPAQIFAQVEMALKNGFLDARPDRQRGKKISQYQGGWDGVIVQPRVTASGRANLKRRAPFWWVGFAFRNEGSGSGILALVGIPFNVAIFLLRSALLALRFKFILPG